MFGAVVDPSRSNGELSITLIATGFGDAGLAGSAVAPFVAATPRAAQAAATGRPWPCGMPSSPLMCGSVLELHRFHNNISQDETTSDSESQQGSDASAAKGTR